MNLLRRYLRICVLPVLALASAVAVPASPEDADLVWFGEDGAERWSATLPRSDAGRGEGVLTVLPWHKQLPDLDVRLFGGGHVPLRGARGSVVVLEFWATWCAPCQRALPKLEALYETHRDAGLKVIAINVGESPQLVLPFAEDMGLTMPIGIYQDSMVPTLFGKAVPTMVVADRAGNIRGRWDTYDEEQDAEVAALIERLLVEQEERPREIATVLRGDGRFRLEWMKQLPTVVEDLVVAPGPGGNASILVSHGRLMAFYLPDGRTEKQWAGDRAAGKLRLAPPEIGSSYLGASFRPGGRTVVLLGGPGREKKKIDLDDHVFDLAWWPDAGQASDRPRLVAGTLGGLLVLDEAGEIVARPEGFGAVSALARVGSGPSSRLLILETAGRLSRVDASFANSLEVRTMPESWALLAAEGAIGVASAEVVAVAAGRFLGGADEQVAVATRSNRLLILSAGAGEILFEAGWEGVGNLAAGDLDGDGADELVVGQGKFMGILTANR